MATISFVIDDSILRRVIDGIAGQNGYQEFVDDGEGNQIPNPQTKMQFAKLKVREYMENCVISYEAVQAAESARQAAIDAANQEIVITDA